MNDIYWTTVAMKAHGGSFVKKLAELVLLADEENLDRLQKAFPATFAKYVVLGQQIKRQEREQQWPELKDL